MDASGTTSDFSHIASAYVPMEQFSSYPSAATSAGSSSSSWVVDKPFQPKKVIRFSSLKRGKEEKPLTEKVKLDRVLGLTVNSNASLDFDPISGSIVYPAGCVVVVFNPRRNKQTHIINASRKTITTLAISIDGKYVATGECGHQPQVRVWDVQEKNQIAEFSGHKFGINCVAFSPNLKYVVSIGSQHDMIVNVWDWRANVKVASNKVSSKVKAVAFSEDGGNFVTVGNRHVKFWYLEYFRSTKYKEPVPLMGRSAILGEQRNNYFCDVACGRGDMAESTFSITKSGLLCEFNSRRLLDKWVELRTTSANCLSVGIDHIFIGCADGIVRCFSPYTLEFITTLPRTHYLGVDVAKGLTIAHMGSSPPGAKYPDAVAVRLDENNNKVTCIYNDHSLYMWDIRDIRKVGKSHSFLYHSACIWGVETYASDLDQPLLPVGSFVTCSSDDTVRIWTLEQVLGNETNFKKNIYSTELLKTLYIDENLMYLCDKDHNHGSNSDKADPTYDSRNGVRCIKIGPDGRHLASGDRSGNIRIHSLPHFEELCKIEAHDHEVLCLEYSKLLSGNRYLASASRDRLIHVFDVEGDYSFLQTLDDHSSSITAVRFVHQNEQMQMISCGADKSVIFRGAHFTPQLQFSRTHHVVGKTTLYDMEVDVNQKYILTACQDRNIRTYNINSGKHCRTFKGSQGEDGTLIKVVFDNSGLFVATSSTDKTLSIYDFASGDCVATMFGHSEIVTGFRFTNDGKYLISVSGDGCIFVWKLPAEITHAIQLRTAQLRNLNRIKIENTRRSTFNVSDPRQLQNHVDHVDNHTMSPAKIFDTISNDLDEEGSYRFSMGPLPLWAKKQIIDEPPPPDRLGGNPNIAQPRGRWAQRIDSQGIVVKSIYDQGHVIPFPESSKTVESDMKRENDITSQLSCSFQDNFEPCPESLTQIMSPPPQHNFPPEVPLGTVTTERGSSFSGFHLHHPTDASPTNVISIDEFDVEQDGDVADDETDSTDTDIQEIIYYPPLEQYSKYSDSEFKVCNTNADDLREMHRKSRKLRAEKPSDVPLVYIQGIRSTDSEDEDDLTPHANDRTISSMFSVSTESLDRVGQREKFLKNNFESLSGDRQSDIEGNDDRLSISSQFLTRNHQPSKEVLSDLKKDPEVISAKKLESMKKIEETRKKLDNIGWKATLNSSKSIGDLTHIPEKDTTFKYPAVEKDKNESIRRASSMSDLSKPKRLLPSPPFNASRNYHPDSYGSLRRNQPRNSVVSKTTRISRSSSLISLTATDQEDSRLTRPTISSMNKTRGGSGDATHRSLPKSASSSHVPRSRRELQNAGSGTSSGEVSPIENKSQFPLRPRSTSMDRGNSFKFTRPESRLSTSSRSMASARSSNRSTSERDLTKLVQDVPDKSPRVPSSIAPSNIVTKISKHELYLKPSRISSSNNSPHKIISSVEDPEVIHMSNSMLEKSPQELPVKDNLSARVDVINASLNRALCEATANDLKLSADNVLQLSKRISMDNNLSESERLELTSILSEAVTEAHQTLKPMHPVSHTSHELNQIPPLPMRKGSDVSTTGVEDILQQYSDRLVTFVQQRLSTQ